MPFAVLFTTYTWDDFVERQYRRALKVTGDGDLYVIADESRGSLPIPSDARTLRTSQVEIASILGIEPLTETGWGKPEPLWWNLDYLAYRFFEEHPEYDYCVMMDYDALITADLSEIIKIMRSKSIDFVAEPIPTRLQDWYWAKPHIDAYNLSEIEGRLLCIIVISREAANHLLSRRREMFRQYRNSALSFWPFCEVFMPVELKRENFKVESLSTFGSVDNYAFRPLRWENDFINSPQQVFVHPVLDNRRYLRAFISEHYSLSDLLKPNTEAGRALRRFKFSEYAPYILSEARKRLPNRLRRNESIAVKTSEEESTLC